VDEVPKSSNLYLVIDRLMVKDDQDTQSRMADSIETAFYEGKNECVIKIITNNESHLKTFTMRFEADGITFTEPSEHLFSFNNPLGACTVCEGFGKVIGIDEDLVIPDKTRSVYDNGVVCWRGEKVKTWRDAIVNTAEESGFPIHTPYLELSDEQRTLLWKGGDIFPGIDDFFAKLEEKQYKIQNRVMLARYRGKTTCKSCNGTRLKEEASYVKVGGKTITELVNVQIGHLRTFFAGLEFTEDEQIIAKRLMIEINSRIGFLCDVGLPYLTLNRLSNSLSGGESQRINLATILGSSLVGSMYVLDEPSIGLHPRDTERLIGILRQLQQLGNTVIVVEHDEDIIRSADYVLDIGPKAGRLGGEVVFADFADKLAEADTLTSRYLSGHEFVPVPTQRRQWRNYLEVKGAAENNLKGINVKFRLEVMTVITGVSGSGKSTLVKRILLPLLQRELSDIGGDRPGSHSSFGGDHQLLKNVEFVDQNPIGKSSRSNPVTYVKAYDDIRNLYSQQHMSKMAGYKPSHFSFNVDGGRCEECQGEGTITVEMQFMADIQLVCENCKGKRFKDEILDVKYKGKTIFDVLGMTVNESIEFFSQKIERYEKAIIKKLKPLQNVGLGYIKLGQSSNTLSGGESQRVKLAFFLSKERADPTMFIFDEPTTGLHFHDVKTLLSALNALISRGHSVLVIEHNMEIIKTADWIIDLGPEGGDTGGNLLFCGTPEDLANCKASYTGHYMPKLKS
jgi:excinuclease ABC subunit A